MRPTLREIPDLADKVHALRCAFDPPRCAKEFREFLGIRSESTLRYYISGSGTRPRGMVPETVFARMVEATKAILSDAGAEEIVDLLDRPAHALEEVLRARSDVTWLRILEKLGSRGEARVIQSIPPEFGMVEVVGEEAEQDDGLYRVRLRARFSLGFPVRFKGHHVVLQQAHGRWAGVPFANARHMYACDVGELVFPGIDGRGREMWLRERAEIGRIRFVCVSARITFPRTTLEALRHGLLEKAALDRLARFIDGQPASGRQLAIVDVDVDDDHGGGA